MISETKGNRIIPSIVTFDEESSRTIGAIAAQRLFINPDNALHVVRGIVGWGFHPAILASFIIQWIRRCKLG